MILLKPEDLTYFIILCHRLEVVITMWSQLWIILQQFFPFLVGFVQTSSYPHPLDKATEEACLMQMAAGDRKARDTLIEHNLRLVVHIVKKFDIRKESFEDLISIGTVGLIKAIDSFDPAKGHKLTTYASKCIENEILMTLRSNKKYANTCSLDDPIGFDKDGESIQLIDVLKDESQPDIIDQMILKEKIKRLHHHLNTLTEKEKRILAERYGLYDQEEKTQKEIACEENISRSYVSRIEKRAFIKLLRAFKKEEN